VAEVIRTDYLEIYKETLAKIEKEPMSNEEVKAYCQTKKINLNKFGKFSQSVCIYSP
jgi:phage host-nuclease inhibitor protein Gam